MIILILFIGFLVGFFITSLYYGFIIDEIIEEFIRGGLYEKQKQDKK